MTPTHVEQQATDCSAWLSGERTAQNMGPGGLCPEGDPDAVQATTNGLLVVFFVALVLLIGRWLHLRHEFSRAIETRKRNMRLAFFAIAVGLLEDLPQSALSLMLGSECGDLDFTIKLSLAVGFLSVIWKCAAPVLLHYGLLN